MSVVAAELVVRLAATSLPGVRLLAEPVGSRKDEPATFAEFQRAFSDHLVPHRELWGFRANSLGFHDIEFTRALPDGSFRIVALGDSFAYGSVPYSNAHLGIAEQLVRFARQRRSIEHTATRFEIDNLGVPASGVADYELIYQFVGRPLHPDLVLVNLYLGNDPQDYADPVRFGAPSSLPRSWLLTFLDRSSRLVLESWRARGVDGAVALPVTTTSDRGRTLRDDDPTFSAPVFSDAAYADIMRNELRMVTRPGSEPGLPDWDAFLSALNHLIERIESDGTPAVLVLAPSRLQVYPEFLARLIEDSRLPAAAIDPQLPNRRIAEYAASHGLPLIDLTPALIAASDGARLYRVNDTHWSLRGNAIAGAELALRLVDSGLVPTEARPPPP